MGSNCTLTAFDVNRSWQSRDHFRLPDEARHQRSSLFNLPMKGFPGGSDGKESTYNAGDMGLTPGSERSPGEGGQSTPISCLENPMDWGAWWATGHRLAKSWTWLKWLTHTQGNTVNKVNKVYLFIFQLFNLGKYSYSLAFFILFSPIQLSIYILYIIPVKIMLWNLPFFVHLYKKYFHDNPCYNFL